MLFEKQLSDAMDMYAEGNEPEFHSRVHEVLYLVKSMKTNKQNVPAEEAERLETWGFALTLLDEHEQAVLKYEEALKLEPARDDLVFRITELLLHQLHRPESAKALLEERLLKNDPDNEEYQEALRLAKLAEPQEGSPEIVSHKPLD